MPMVQLDDLALPHFDELTAPRADIRISGIDSGRRLLDGRVRPTADSRRAHVNNLTEYALRVQSVAGPNAF
jgi:hypothetical protein